MAVNAKTIGDNVRQMNNAELAYIFCVVLERAIPHFLFSEQERNGMVDEFRRIMLAFLESPAEEV